MYINQVGLGSPVPVVSWILSFCAIPSTTGSFTGPVQIFFPGDIARTRIGKTKIALACKNIVHLLKDINAC
jgi:hypothetical protein